MKQLLTLMICLLVILLAAELAAAQKPELVVQTGHSDHVDAVAFSPDGQILASGGEDQTIKLWDVATGTELRSLSGHSGFIVSIVFTSDSKTLASSDFFGDSTVRIWDIKTGALLHLIKCGPGPSIRSLAFSHDDKMLAGANGDGTVRLWDTASGVERRRLPGKGDVGSVAFSPDGQILASAGYEDNSVKLWNLSTGESVDLPEKHKKEIRAIAFSPDGGTLASGSNDGAVKLWDMKTRTVRLVLQQKTVFADLSLSFSPDGRTLAVSGGEVMLWDVTTGTILHTLDNPGQVNSVAFSPDGRVLAAGGGSMLPSAEKTERVKLWDVRTGQALSAFEGHTNAVVCVALSPNGRSLASAEADVISIWDLRSNTPPRSLQTPVSIPAVVNPTEALSEVQRRATAELLRSKETVTSLAFSPDGTLLASGHWSNDIKLWDTKTGNLQRTFRGHTDRVDFVTFSPDGRTLASTSQDETIRVWDLNTALTIMKYSFSKDDTDNLSLRLVVSFSPDGNLLAFGGWDGAVRLWDIKTGNLQRIFPGREGYIDSVTFSPDGKTLLSTGEEGTALLDLGTKKVLWRKSDPDVPTVFSPDGAVIAGHSSNHNIKLWNPRTGEEIQTLKGHRAEVTSIAFSADGKKLVSGSYDSTIRYWDLRTGAALVSMIVLDKDDWLVVDSGGYFDGSTAAWTHVIWRFNNNTFDHAPVEAFFNEFYYPGLLADVFAGKHPKAPSDISQKDRRQPQLKVMLARDVGGNPTVRESARTVAVKIDVVESPADKDHKAGSGAQDLRLFRNGSLVKVWRGDVLKGQSSVTLEETVSIVEGRNTFTAYAFNRDNIKSSDATLVVNGAENLKRQGTAYILAVGVNSYSNSQYNLKYAVADAEDFSAEVKRQQELLKRYAQVEIISLQDAEATKANITQKLAELATRVQPEDAVIVYFAGHGTAYGNQFYLIPHDLGYNGPREKLNEAGLQTILAHSISDRELEKLFEGIDAGQLLLVIDACNSGQALEAEEKRRGPMNSKGLAQLAYEKGMYVLTAAQSYQAAQEAARFGHGFLTYALVEDGLKQGKADREPKDRAINLREWLNYATEQVPRMQEENMLDALRGRSRYLNFVGDGSGPKDTKNNVQRPRIFYRRELDSNPLVVAVVGATAPQ